MTEIQKERNILLAEDLENFKDQARNKLRRGNKFCCLGRACEVFRLATKRGGWEEDIFILGDKKFIHEPPYEVMRWFGWGDANNIPFLPDIGYASLANDRGVTFKRIAKGFRDLVKKYHATN